jgi:hypothetical protein
MRNLEYCMLHEVKPVGPILGFLADREIFEAVVDQFGRMFRFAGVVSRKANGDIDENTLAPGEFILRPGLIYRHVDDRSQRRAKFFG